MEASIENVMPSPPTLELHASNGTIFDATGCIYTNSSTGRTASVNYLITKETLNAMAVTCGAPTDLGGFWNWFKGAVKVVSKWI